MVAEGRGGGDSAREKNSKKAQETLGDNTCVHYLGCSDGFMVKTVKIYQILYTSNICSYYTTMPQWSWQK